MTRFTPMEILPEDANLPEDVLLLEPRSTFDRALLGFAHMGGVQMAVYSRELTIQALITYEEMEWEEAVEHFEFNVSGSIGLGHPVFMLDENDA